MNNSLTNPNKEIARMTVYEDSVIDLSEYYWCYLPEVALLQVFSFLDYKEVLNTGLVCKSWNSVSYDDLLWRDMFHRDFKVDKTSYPTCKPKTWLSEYKRLCYHIPIAQSENLTEHKHQVLHVSFAHNGKYFATCSKDGFILVYTSNYPAHVKYSCDMKQYNWKYTQYSQINESDTLLLVSGVHFGTPHSTSGEIAVFSLVEGFQLQCRVMNKPYDIFGTWYSDRHLLSGDRHWLAHLVSTSLLWLNKASQESDSEHVPITFQLYKFYNRRASSIRAIMVANCLTEEVPTPEEHDESLPGTSQAPAENNPKEIGNPLSHRDINQSSSSTTAKPAIRIDNSYPRNRNFEPLNYAMPFVYNCDYRQQLENTSSSDSESEGPLEEVEEDFEEENFDKYLIFTTGSQTYTPHQIGFKRMKPFSFPKRLDPGPSLNERLLLRQRAREMQSQIQEPNWLNFDSVADKFDKIDHLIDLHGHIIGMALSPDHRYLYVNNRPWPQGYCISNPLEPPPIAQEIDIHVIDLVNLKEVGQMLRAHKAYTPNNECFFIFLDVCAQYVASGAEDRHGYLWDRHYGCCLAKFPHDDVVNAVAFNPRDPEMLVTTSDDEKIKVWRSRNRLEQLGVNINDLPKAVEVRKVQKRK